MKRLIAIIIFLLSSFAFTGLASAEHLPFKQKVEVYRHKDGDVLVFALHLEQPFLAEEFEKSNYLRLHALDDHAYLIYPKETRFDQKHAAFYGRLRGQGNAKVRLSYEIVTENIDGSRRVEVRQGELQIPIPSEETGHEETYREWARRQNEYFLSLLNYYPQETFFQYCLLQSQDRYGITPPELKRVLPMQDRLEADLYRLSSGPLAIQKSLQAYSYTSAPVVGDHNVHISQLAPPELHTLSYKELLKEKTEKGIMPAVHEIAKFVPHDQYMLQLNSADAATELTDLTRKWGDSVLRLFTVHAQHNRIQEKLDDQLGVRYDPLIQLFADRVIEELAITGTDVFVFEGSDVTLIFKLKQPDVFDNTAEQWLAEVRKKYPSLVEREFNYRGHKIAARYTEDRMVSSFVVRHEGYAVYSNSHVTIRKIVDTIIGASPRLYDALDYQYVSTILPPSKDLKSGYFYASEEFLKRQFAPAMKISEKRRLQCFNNLIMINNASLFYRLEYGKSPRSLTDLVKGRFIDPKKLVCPHGGTYAFDAEHDTATCSLHNRIKYLTPNTELEVLKVSSREKAEYDRYKQRYQQFWQKVFDPVAIRISLPESRIKLEACVLPFANGDLYNNLRSWVNERPQQINTAHLAKSAVISAGITLGQKNIGEYLKAIPGISDTLKADPTLTDLNWLGDGVSLNLCDGESILEVDLTRLKPLHVMGEIPVPEQSLAGFAFLAANLPSYITIEVTDPDKAQRFLDQLSSRIILKGSNVMGMPTTFDAYQLPDYKGHAIYTFSYQLYTLKIRLHVALVQNRLMAATRPQTLQEVIDAAEVQVEQESQPVHLLFRLNLKAIDQLKDDLRFHWEEKSRRACHSNIIAIYNLVKLYGASTEEIPRLSEAKYGVTYYCPEHGHYEYDDERNQVTCSVHGNRQESRQTLGTDQDSSFSQFFESLQEIIATLRFQEDSLLTTLEIERKP